MPDIMPLQRAYNHMVDDFAKKYRQCLQEVVKQYDLVNNTAEISFAGLSFVNNCPRLFVNNEFKGLFHIEFTFTGWKVEFIPSERLDEQVICQLRR